MNEEIKQRLQKKDIWQRGFFMLLYMSIYGFSNFLMIGIFFFQFATLIITGETNALLLKFSQGLGIYLRQIIMYMSFNSDQLPFPFSAWPGDHNEQSQNDNSGSGN